MLVEQFSPDIRTNLSPAQREGMNALASWNLDDVKARAQASMGWSEAFADEALMEYRKYIALVALQPSKTFGMVETIDAIWHEHILNTRSYLGMCAAVAGGVIHHEQQPVDDNSSSQLAEARQSTLQGMAGVFEGAVSPLWTYSDGSNSYAKCCNGHIAS
jgi:hypothetical protein